MPNCTATQVPFAKLGRREVDVRFDGGDVSSDGGLLLLRQVERRLGLLKAVAKALPDQRQPWLVQHTAEQLLRQRVFGLCQGYEDLNDHDRLRDDLALQTAVGDVAATNRIVARERTPVVLVGHSYGGVVITEAGSDPRVAGLVYIAAFGPVGTARVFC